MSTEHRLAIKSAAWLTYAWEDNRSGDVDFVAQELVEAGVEIKLDRWNLKAGVRLWNQTAKFIQDPAHSNAWILYATQNSLGSEPCREEFAYALERALKGRGESFPVIGLFPGRVDKQLIPPGISTRLYVSLTDPDWKTRVAAALEGKDPSIQRPNVQPYEVRVHRDVRGAPGGGPIVIELRPRAGTWVPFFLNIAAVEADAVRPHVFFGARGTCRSHGFMISVDPKTVGDVWVQFYDLEATPTMSYFVSCAQLPSTIAFGVPNGGVAYQVVREGDVFKHYISKLGRHDD